MTRNKYVFGLLLLRLGVTWLPASQVQPDNNLVQRLSEGNSHFAFKYFKILVDQENAIMSPFSIRVALTMTSFGARKNTLKQLNDALELNGFSHHMDIAKAYSSALESLDLKGDITLIISNRIFIEKSYQIKQQFKDILENQFHSVAQSVQFLNDGQNFNNEINKWVEQATKDKIKTLTPLGGGDKYTGAVLVSAIYFKGIWKKRFEKEKTNVESFQTKNRKKQSVPMMNMETHLDYTENPILDSKILKLEYAGSRIEMYVFLPNQLTCIKKLKHKLNFELFQSIMKSMQPRLIKLKLPKFNFKYTKDMSSDLPHLRITDLTSEASVDLDGIAEPKVSGSHLFVQKVLYAADVEVDEEGAMAVGAPQPSGSGVGAASASGAASWGGNVPQTPLEFYANRPFVFILYDTFTNLILFIGSVDDINAP